jgi:hypothetical protein
MYEDDDAERLKLILDDRLQSLYNLYSGDLISKNTLSSQLLELIGTQDAKTFWDLTMKKDITARRMLTMLEDPELWKKDSSSPEEDRPQILKKRLTDEFLNAEDSSRDVLEILLDIASLPHFESIVFPRNSKSQGKKSGAKFSILD